MRQADGVCNFYCALTILPLSFSLVAIRNLARLNAPITNELTHAFDVLCFRVTTTQDRFALCIVRRGFRSEGIVTTVALLTAEQIAAIVETAVTRALSVKSDESEILTREQVAEMLKVHPVTVTQYAKKKGLRGIQLTGGDWRFRRSDVDAWLEQRATEGK